MKVTITHLSWNFSGSGNTAYSRINAHKRASKVPPIYLYSVRIIRSSEASHIALLKITCIAFPIHKEVNQDSYERVKVLLDRFLITHAPTFHLLSVVPEGSLSSMPSFDIEFHPLRGEQFTHTAVKLLLALAEALHLSDLPAGRIPYPHIYLETSVKTRQGELIPYGQALMDKFYPRPKP
jgi:hypothetical protein